MPDSRPSPDFPVSSPRRGGIAPRGPRVVAALRPMRHVLTLSLLALVFGAGVLVDRAVLLPTDRAGAGAAQVDAAPETDRLAGAAGYQILEETWEVIQEQYVDLANVDQTALFRGASAGMVEALGDTGHSRFLDPAEAEAFERALNSEVIGIGFSLVDRGGQVIVGGVVDGGPADEAGVQAGDVVLAVDGEDTVGAPLETVGDLLAGEAGEDVALRFYRPASDEEFAVDLTRRLIEIDPVSWGMLPDGIAFIRISVFATGATEGLREAIAGAEREGAVGVVLDLRGNPGGLVSEAIGVASQFLEPGTVLFQQAGRDDDPVAVPASGEGDAYDLPLTVLVNGGSASAAEIVGAALRDNGRATLIGQQTFGTGTVLTPVDLPDGSVVVIGSQRWLTADGGSVWREGVAPDEVVQIPYGEQPVIPSDDPEITRAELGRLEDPQLVAAQADAAEQVATARAGDN